MGPRIAPVPTTGNPQSIQELVDASVGNTGGAQNIFLTFANHPGLFRRYLPFGGKLLLGGKLPPRDRELVILRTAWRCGSDYEWGQHVRIGLAAGVARDEIDRIAGETQTGWERHDAALLSATDQLIATHRLDDATWAALSSVYDDPQMIELTLLVGHYAMLAGMLNSVGVEREAGVEDFPPS